MTYPISDLYCISRSYTYKIPLDAAPPLKDCSEVYRAGVRAPGWYQLDTSGSKNNTGDRDVYCEDGWTQILRRNADKTYDRTVCEKAWIHVRSAYSVLLRFPWSISKIWAVTITREVAENMKTTSLDYNESTSKKTKKKHFDFRLDLLFLVELPPLTITSWRSRCGTGMTTMPWRGTTPFKSRQSKMGSDFWEVSAQLKGGTV